MIGVREQTEMLKRGAAEIVPEAAFLEKLEGSVATGRPLKVKLGIDPTAQYVTLGWAVVLRKLRQFQDLGHDIILVIGDFTAMIGDPSGRNRTRPRLSEEEVAAYAERCLEQIFLILDSDLTTVVRNSEWLSPIGFERVIELASKVTVAQILEREDFATRLEQQRPLSLHEILYPLCQAYDSVALEANLEMGGIDQKFNILMGRELQREFGQEPQVGFFMPLLVGLDGKAKMSQSLDNYVGIVEEPQEMFGKLMSINDDLMRDYFVLCTDMVENDIETILLEHPMDAKKRLASEIVGIYHGALEAQKAQGGFEQVFSQRELPDCMPEVPMESGDLEVVDLLRKCTLVNSNNEARRLIEQGGVEINGVRIGDVRMKVTVKAGDVVRVGKRRFTRIIIAD